MSLTGITHWLPLNYFPFPYNMMFEIKFNTTFLKTNFFKCYNIMIISNK